MNKNLPQKKREGVFIKIKEWFLRFSGIQRSTQPLLEETVKQEESKTEFINGIKVENKDKIFMLKRKIEEKQIEISDLTNQELDDLIQLYKEQIEEKKAKLKQYRIKIN